MLCWWLPYTGRIMIVRSALLFMRAVCRPCILSRRLFYLFRLRLGYRESFDKL